MGADSTSVDILSAPTLHPLAIKSIIESLQGNQYRPNGFSEPSFLLSEMLEERRLEIETLVGGGGSIWFTSGADESATWAIRGILATNSSKGNRIEVKEDAHVSLFNAAKRFGGKNGEIVIAAASAMDIETGRILDLEKWNSEIKSRNISPKKILDARSTIGRIPLTKMCEFADAIILDSESIGGPVGIGALWVRHGTRIQPLIEGSGQESGRRGGGIRIRKRTAKKSREMENPSQTIRIFNKPKRRSNSWNEF
jgi:cysteine desulfurase